MTGFARSSWSGKVSHAHVHAVLWNRMVLPIQRRGIVWDESNMRWETVLLFPTADKATSHVRPYSPALA